MKLTKKKLLLVLVGVCSTILSIWLTTILAEKFFFDKFFYYKSIKHGYWVPDKKISFADFGERAKDLLQLEQDYGSLDTKEDILGVQDDTETYTIAIIGDSFVWGQGLKFEDTISQQLEKELNQYGNTTVLSLGISGDSILDYAMRFDMVKQIYPVDLYIFVLVDNDLLLVNHLEEKYKQTSIFHDCQERFPDQKPIYDLPPESYGEIRNERLDRSWSLELNLCILNQSLKSLPTDNAIYFVSQHYHEEDYVSWKTYKDSLEKNQKEMLYVTDGKTLEEYKHFWEDPWKYFYVSRKDFHPSKIANRMFADLLSNEILNNPRWGW